MRRTAKAPKVAREARGRPRAKAATQRKPTARSAPAAGPNASKAPVWAARTGAAAAPAFAAYSESTRDDAPFVAYDCEASIAHVAGLRAAGLLEPADASRLVEGLQRLAARHAAGTWRLDPGLEDVHMNLEARLIDLCGEAGRRVHTGRSRNDQVAACLVLHAREHLGLLSKGLHALAAALAGHAHDHATTPWVARTHGLAAQPATLGFLLAAHAWRCHDAATATLAAANAVAESPLGSGAVAGSTLPLRPDAVASLLRLRAPRNALLATGTRDASLAACRSAAAAGTVMASLAQDLLELFWARAVALAPGHTTGSSLMPQKRNPDLLELARGHALALAGHMFAVEAVVAGRGLGYVRDFQVVKPHQIQALATAAATAAQLADAVAGARFDGDVLAASLAQPSIAATDMAEALVAQGMPFRDAYTTVANALRDAEGSGGVAPGPPKAAPAPVWAGLPQAARAVASPDPSRRATLGGPAPARVKESLRQLGAAQAKHADALEALLADVAAAHGLLSAPSLAIFEDLP